MADNDAVRQARRRAHAAGDHSLCRPRCGSRAVAKVPDLAPPEPVPAAFPQITVAEAFPPVVTDPARSLRGLAGRLEAAHVADPANAMVARELRATLLVLAGSSPRPEDAVDRIRREYEETVRGL